MAISQLPVAPSRQRPAQFSDEADAFLGALPAFGNEANALATDVNNKQVAAAASAATATSEADRATAQANASAASATSSSNYATNSANSATASENSAIASASSATQSANSATAAQNSATAAASSAAFASSEADRAEAAADSVAGGPVASINGKTGIVTLTATDIGPAATQAEAEAGTETELRMWSPNRVAQAISSLASSKILRSARTSNMQLVKADNGKLIDITSGTFTQTFAAASELGDGWFCYLKNSGAGDITLDPNNSETIDGLSSYIMYPGEVRLVQCDGVELRTVVLNSFYRVFTASGTFIKPPGYAAFSIIVFGAGGSGGICRPSTTQIAFASGGGGGAYSRYCADSLLLRSTETVVIGSGGIGKSATDDGVGVGGSAGGSSSFGGIFYANGGSGGLANINSVNQAEGGQAQPVNTGGVYQTGAASGSSGTIVYAGANSVNAGAGGGSAKFSGPSGPLVFTAGGSSTFAGSGGSGNATSTSNALNGAAPGGGGGGCAAAPGASVKSGDGGRGEIRVWGVI